jgi:hypothetical protein
MLIAHQVQLCYYFIPDQIISIKTEKIQPPPLPPLKKNICICVMLYLSRIF